MTARFWCRATSTPIASFLVGGQIRGEPPRLFNVYGEGNFIEATAETCYFQSGETKYGKPIIDRVINRRSSLVDATKCTIVSFDSTMRSNISVGLPIDLVVYESDALRIGMQRRIDEDDPYYQMVHRQWGDGLRQRLRPVAEPRLDLMAIRVALQHRTTYRFDRNVGLAPHEIRLRPAPHCRTPILGYSLNVTPDRYFLNWQQDPYGNWVARLVFTEPAAALDIVVDLTADMSVLNPFDFFVEPYAEFFPFRYAPALAKELIPFLETEPAGPLLSAWLDRFRPTIHPGEKTVDLLVRLNQRLQSEVNYLVRMEPGVQSPDETLAQAQGSCRDTGWLLVQITAAPGPRRAIRLGVPDPTRRRREAARRARGAGTRFHRPARLGGGISAGRGLDRTRPDVRAARGRGAHPARLHRRSGQCGAGDRRH